MDLKEGYFTKKIIGRPMFWKELPSDFIVTRFLYDPNGFYLTVWYIYTEEKNIEFIFNVYADNSIRHKNEKYIGWFKQGDLKWHIYARPSK